MVATFENRTRNSAGLVGFMSVAVIVTLWPGHTCQLYFTFRKLDLGEYRWMSYDDANALSEEVGREGDDERVVKKTPRHSNAPNFDQRNDDIQ